jgi:succinate dehydrogenase/fumarate reductase-like Fe-S protein
MQENFKDASNFSFEFHYPENSKTIDPYTYEHNQSFLDWLGDIWQSTQSLSFKSQCEDPECVYCKNKLNG